jgi:spore coat protein U-like protein
MAVAAVPAVCVLILLPKDYRMRNILFSTAAAIAALSSTAAFAAEGPTNTTGVNITTTLAKACTISTPGTDVALTGTASSTTPMTVTCNFSGNPTLTYTSLNGGAKSTGPDGNTVDYYVNYNSESAGPGNWTAGSLGTGQSHTATGVTPGTPLTTPLAFALVAAPTIAGTYTDTMTITVTP